MISLLVTDLRLVPVIIGAWDARREPAPVVELRPGIVIRLEETCDHLEGLMYVFTNLKVSESEFPPSPHRAHTNCNRRGNRDTCAE